jgi:hypothetical protein
MIVTADYAKQWGLVLKKDGVELVLKQIDTDAGQAVVEIDGEDAEHPLSDLEIEGYDRFMLLHNK